MSDTAAQPPCTLLMRDGRLHVQLGTDDPVPAKIVYLRPLSSRSEVTFLNDDSEEILTLHSLDQLQPACRELALDQLAQRYHLPLIQRVETIRTIFGTHYWKVQTDKGRREFAFKEPGKNVTHVPPSRIILRDTIGNRYEISDMSSLDPHSRRQVSKVL